ncbi:hypothetical protein SAMN05216262_11383 [Colwellia chukchiensis]|uniref:Uncharacterized protein n=1 Tax=Colwellia chukchiensis TaxID=641665 RepID=A0A1H7R4S3_9GAMM|nr:hypothetical protein [Colwellia chukchiensis]SEL55183.1 hypothetical protein SAMN05216262_11383 [Colwellia chukchiensis]
MAHEEAIKELESKNKAIDVSKTIEQQLIDANAEIEDLKLQIAWLERSYE